MPDETTIRLLSLFFFYIGKGENCPKEERWRSQIDSARLVLDRSSTLLLTSSKAFQRYSDGDYKNKIKNLLKGGSLAKSRKLFFQGRSFLEGKIQKMQKKISKNFIVPNRLLGHTDHLYTYKGHIEHIGFT